MDEAVRNRLLGLPSGIDRRTRQPVPLERVLGQPETVAAPQTVSTEEWIALVRARWLAGEWHDILYGHTEVDLTTAIAELEAQSAMGKDLLEIVQGAIEMSVEVVQESRSS
ncbi:hypothetical protein ACIGXM_31635 [Kitasatospora sp. NPDC052896]|uniref:hypothetical protein n=1 Tax=Kitasatospora sp. NPDC052896 TaxID=3364061 RepID=UPI0037C65987